MSIEATSDVDGDCMLLLSAVGIATGLQPHDGQLEAPPPRRKTAAAKKGKKAAVAAAAADGCSSDDEQPVNKGRGKKSAAAGNKAKRTTKQKADSNDSREDGIVSDLTTSKVDEVEHTPTAAADRRARAVKGKSIAAGTHGWGKAGRDKATAELAGNESSDGGFDAEAENHHMGAAGKGAKVGKPPAKRAKRGAVTVAA